MAETRSHRSKTRMKATCITSSASCRFPVTRVSARNRATCVSRKKSSKPIATPSPRGRSAESSASESGVSIGHERHPAQKCDNISASTRGPALPSGPSMKRSLTIGLIGTLVLVPTPARGHAGDLDPAFSGNGIATAFKTGSVAHAVAVDHAGRDVVVGQTTDDHVDVAVARFRPDGTPDPSFGANGRVRMSLGANAAVAFDVAVTADDGLAI